MIKNIFTVAPMLVKLLGSMAHNDHGFVQVGDFITVRPGLKHKSVTADEDNK
jgi:hypothetical protein